MTSLCRKGPVLSGTKRAGSHHFHVRHPPFSRQLLVHQRCPTSRTSIIHKPGKGPGQYKNTQTPHEFISTTFLSQLISCQSPRTNRISLFSSRWPSKLKDNLAELELPEVPVSKTILVSSIPSLPVQITIKLIRSVAIDKGVDTALNKAGHGQSHSTTEKISDGIRK